MRGDRLVQPVLDCQNAAKIVMRLRERRIDLDRPRERGDRLLEIFVGGEGGPEFAMSGTIGRPNFQHFAKRRPRLFEPALFRQQAAEISIGFGKAWIDANRPPNQIDRRVRVSLLPGQHAGQMEGIGIIGPALEDFPIEFCGLRQPAGLVVLDRRFQTLAARHLR